MTKTVFDGQEVAHLWAHQAQDHARNSVNNVSFCGDEFRSYATAIARHIKNKRGEKAVIVATGYYSSTTCKHQCWVRYALRDTQITVFHVDRVGDAPREYFKQYGERVVKMMGQWERARDRKPVILREIEETVEEANRFAAFHGLRQRLTTDFAEMQEASRKIAEANKRADARKAKAREKARLAALAEGEEKRAAWIEGKEDSFPDAWQVPVRLRIVGNELQTSLSASVPLQHAKKLFKIIKHCKETGQEYHSNGHTEHIGHYPVDYIHTDGSVKIGCHTVEWPEVERVAKLAGVA